MTDRVQLNLRLDGRRDLLEAIKEVASAEGLSVNAWVIKTLESAVNSAPEPASQPVPQNPSNPDIESVLDNTLDTMLDNKIAAKFAEIEERLGKLSA